MSKALGFLTGVCLTVMALLLVLDRWQSGQPAEPSRAAVVPDVEPLDTVPNATDTASITIDDGSEIPSVDTVSEDSLNSVSPAADAEKNATVEPDAVIPSLFHPGKAKAEPQHTRVDPPAAMLATAADKQLSEVSVNSDASPTQNRDLHVNTDNQDTAQTHIFWSPFRSEWAARGFARRLTNATQIPIEIVEAGSSQYRVSFDYQDEAQRQEHVERIESITGLQLE